MMREFKVGEFVLHRAGGPELVVQAVDGDDVTVTWSVNGEPRTGTFKSHTLMRPFPRSVA